jgi:serine/threonine-protein kinase PknG
MSPAYQPLACTVPGCRGVIEDGYCNVCGTPGPAGSAAPAPLPGPGTAASSPHGPASPSAALGTGFVAGRPATAAEAAAGRSGGVGGASSRTGSSRTGSVRTGRTNSSQLATAALGSARQGAGRTRRVGTASTRLRTHRLGAGLTTVEPMPVADPQHAVMADPEVPEAKRFCPRCGGPVGRARGETPGRTEGFCPACGTKFDLRPALKAGDLVGGQYEVVGAIAHGGLGWIYLARDQNVSGRWVVLKGLLNADDEDALAAAIAERQFLAEVEHPLIVEIYNFATFEGAGYIVMEYVGGTSLKQILKDRRDKAGTVNPLPVDTALAYILEILPAFSYLHDRGLLYCDFKPDNLIAEGEGVKLIDLGGVRRIDDDRSAIFGTVGYQAPEVPEVGPSIASDVYTIGRTLATLVLDFRGNTTTYVASLPPVAETPVFVRYDSFYRLLAKACALDPDDRFGTVDELRGQMLGVLREVVATDRGADVASTESVTSALFEAPGVDVADRPLEWRELPRLRTDEHDPQAAWLAGVTIADPVQRLRALQAAPAQSVEVLLARAYAEIEAQLPVNAQTATTTILDTDPWEWRAVWMTGLAQMARGEHVSARASFNAVYGQVPGELAPKLALATACELTGELDVAEALYRTCARSDSNYASPAAFGLARIRQAFGDLDGALAALDLVNSTRGSYPQARVARARMLVASGRGLAALDSALSGVDSIAVPDRERAQLRVDVLEAALALVIAAPRPPAPAAAQRASSSGGPGARTTTGAAGPGAGGRAARRKARTDEKVAGVVADEPNLRDAAEKAYRELAVLASSPAERDALVDRANHVRRWTTV